MKTLMITAAALALVAGITVANAQGNPGAGSPGQDQRPQVGTKTGPASEGGAAKTQDAPTPRSDTSTSPSGTTGANPSGSMSRPSSGAIGNSPSEEKKEQGSSR